MTSIRRRLELDLDDLKGINDNLSNERANLAEQLDDQKFRLENERHETDKLRMDLSDKNNTDASFS